MVADKTNHLPEEPFIYWIKNYPVDKVISSLKNQGMLVWYHFVYVIGLHAVQFGNNWMRKIPRTAKLDEAVGRVQFGSTRNFLDPIISKLDSM